MKLILTNAVENLGEAGDTVEVRDGYGRNYLLPRGLAIVATRGAEKQVEGIRRAQAARSVRDLDHANEIKQALEGLENVSLTVKTHDSGKLFGSVTATNVASRTAEATNMPIVVGSDQPSDSARVKPYTSATRPSVDRKTPGTSSGERLRPPAGSRITK